MFDGGLAENPADDTLFCGSGTRRHRHRDPVYAQLRICRMRVIRGVVWGWLISPAPENILRAAMQGGEYFVTNPLAN